MILENGHTTCFGRETELKTLDERLRQVHGSDYGRRALVIQGPVGVGKTHLMSAFRRLVLEQGGWIFEGHCGSGNGQAYAPFNEILTAIEAFVPSSDDTLGELSDVGLFGSQLNYFESVRQRLQTVAVQRPTVFYLHDLEVADDDSVELLKHLLNDWSSQLEPLTPYRREGFRGLLVISLKKPHVRGERLLQELSSIDVVEQLPLRGLDRRGLASFLQHSDILDRVYALTEGNPTRIQQIIHTLPENVSDLAARRRELLSEDQQRVLQLLSVCDRALNLGELSNLCGVPSARIARSVRALVRGHFLERVLQNGEVRFKNGSLAPRDGVLSELTTEALTTLHCDCLDHYRTQLAAGESIALLDQAVHHALQAGAIDEAIEYSLKTAAILERSLSYERAIRTLQTVESFAGDHQRSQELLRLLSHLYRKVANFDRARQIAESLLGRISDPVTRVETLAFLGEVSNKLGKLDRSTDYYEQALQAAERHAPGKLAAVRLGLAELLFVRGELNQAETLSRDVLAGCDPGPETISQRYQAKAILGKIFFQKGRYAESRRLYTEALDLVAPLGWERERARALHNLGLNELKTGQPRSAIRLIEQSRDICEKINEYEGLSLCLLNLGVAYEYCQEFGTSIEVYHRSISLIEKIGRRTSLSNALYSLGEIYLTLGSYHEARECFHRADVQTKEHDTRYIGALTNVSRGRLALETGKLKEARRLLHDGLEYLLDADSVDHLGRCYLYLAEAGLENGGEQEAQTWIERLQQLGLPSSNETLAYAQLISARIALGHNKLDESIAHHRQAIRMFQSQDQLEGLVVAFGGLAQVYAQALGENEQASDLYKEMSRHLELLLQKVPTEYRQLFAEKPAIARPLEAYRGHVTQQQSPTVEVAAQRAVPAEITADWRQSYREIIGESAALTRVLKLGNKIAASDSTVLILGESGTGKELLAEALYRQGRRAGKPFVRVNTAALSESLLLSELFGHEKGAFTGAVSRKIGKFEQADGGTIFLDEIGDISAKTQVSLLRVLQEQEFERVGGTRPVKINVRVILATNRDLETMVNQGRFRLDLYYRINGLTLRLPALRERRDDIQQLVQHFVGELELQHGRRVSVDPRAMAMLQRYDWPGNIRELKNVLHSVYFFAEGDRIVVDDIVQYSGVEGLDPTAPATTRATDEIPSGFDLVAAKKELEVEYIKLALQQKRGNITHAAELLAMKRSRLSQKIKEHEIDVKSFKTGSS